MEIRKTTALVTGAAKRVGKTIALALANKGVNIALHYHTSETEAHTTAEEIRSLGVKCNLFQADLSDANAVSQMADEALKKTNGIDILINSASIFYKTPLASVKELDWDKFLDTNLKAPFILCQKIGNDLFKKNGGRIINIADWSGFRPYRDYSAYCTSKGGLITLTKALARDLAPKVFANAIAPGPVLLPADFTEEEKEAATRKTLLGRVGTPEDIANAVLFLLDNDYINGTVLTVDGGRSIV